MNESLGPGPGSNSAYATDLLGGLSPVAFPLCASVSFSCDR